MNQNPRDSSLRDGHANTSVSGRDAPAAPMAGFSRIRMRMASIFRPTDDLELQRQFERHVHEHLRTAVLVLGVLSVIGGMVSIAARLMLEAPQHMGLRLILLPAVLLAIIGLHLAPSVRIYGIFAHLAAAGVCYFALLGTAGLEHPLLHFLPSMMLVLLISSFFLMNFRQWLIGVASCYIFIVPYALQGLDQTDAIYGAMHLVLTLIASFAAHYWTQDFRWRSFLQESRLASMSVTDELTGIYNRRQFFKASHRISIRLKEANLPLCMVYLDIDQFKTLNDGYGHAAGDEVLRKLAEQLQYLIRPQDIVGRLGGEEFGITLPECVLADAMTMAERIRTEVAHIDRPDGRLSVSIGIAQQRVYENLADTLHRADLAMLQAKAAGRNAVVAAAV